MKKSILNLGKALTKSEQKNVFGGEGTTISEFDPNCLFDSNCCGPDNPCPIERTLELGVMTLREGTCMDDGLCYYS